MMKIRLKYIIVVAIALVSLLATAQTEPSDTIYFYKTWQQMLDLEPQAFIVNPFIQAESPYEVYILTGYEEADDIIEREYIAMSQGDSIWLVNSNYLKKNFKGDTKNLSGFVPVFFNEKVAFVTGSGPLTVKDILFGEDRDDVSVYNYSYYYIDFLNRKVKRVTHSSLSVLLEQYHDLQMRYEGMKDYKKSYIIEDYFYKFIDRATQDIMQPYILDLVE